MFFVFKFRLGVSVFILYYNDYFSILFIFSLKGNFCFSFSFCGQKGFFLLTTILVFVNKNNTTSDDIDTIKHSIRTVLSNSVVYCV